MRHGPRSGPLKRVFNIDIPLLFPQFRIVVILSGIYAVQNFIPILLLTNAAQDGTLVPGLDMYQSAFQNDQYGYGMAIGTLRFIHDAYFHTICHESAPPTYHLRRGPRGHLGWAAV